MENENIKPSALIPGQQITRSNDEDEGLAVGEIVAVVMEHRWLVATITAAFLVLGGAYSFVAKPVYKADGLIQVEEKSTGGMSAMMKDLGPLLGDSTTVAAEQEILTSRMVLGRVINKLKLDIEVTPKTFPVIGRAMARRYKGIEPASPWLGMNSYAWGGEEARVDALEVPRTALDKPLMLVAEEGGRYSLLNEDGDEILSGKAGERARGNKYEVFVAKLQANPGTRFVLVKQSQEMVKL